MASSDRAFRALARASPRNVLALLRLLELEVHVAADDVVALDDPNLDVPPHPREADLVVRVGEPDLFHVECQGYVDPAFLDRVFGYHLVLTLRHPERHVRTFVIWTRLPKPHQRTNLIRRGDVSIEVQTMVLPEVPAQRLLAHPETACFAAGAHPGPMSVEELCDRVAAALRAKDASFEEKYVAAMVAATQGRYAVMVRAMEKHHMQPVIIEDLVDYGFEQGIEKGIEKGIERGIGRGRLDMAREALLDLFDARGLSPTDPQRRCILAEIDEARLRAWHRAAATAATVDEVIGQRA
jgi:hypothetical protein